MFVADNLSDGVNASDATVLLQLPTTSFQAVTLTSGSTTKHTIAADGTATGAGLLALTSAHTYIRVAALNRAGRSSGVTYAPSILDVNPKKISADSGGFITVSGVGLGTASTMAFLEITVGSAPCTAPDAGVGDGTTVTCLVPPGLGASLNLKLNYTSRSMRFVVVSSGVISYVAPVVSSLTPSVVNTTSAVTVTILGTGFGPSATVAQVTRTATPPG